MSILSHNDSPVWDDRFENQEFIESVCQLIRQCTPPKGIGINGYWGTGKTSSLLQVYVRLCGQHPFGEKLSGSGSPAPPDPGILPVWFEAWRYQHEAQPIVALLHAIQAQLSGWEKLKKQAQKIGEVTLLGILSAFDEVAKVASGGVIKPELAKLKAIGEAYEQEHVQKVPTARAIQDLLQKAVEAAFPKNKPGKLVLFIDDLDRCQADKALQLMEGIKIYLNLNNCVVLFGMDQRQVENALVQALKLPPDQATHQAREYLEKICQDILHVPLPDRRHKSAYLHELLKALGTDASYLAVIDQLQAITDHYDCLPANPRKIKALANRLATMVRRLPTLGLPEATFSPDEEATPFVRSAALVLLTAICSCFHRELYEQLRLNPAYSSILIEWSTSGASTEALRGDNLYQPMHCLVPARVANKEMPVNPSDANVFRLHQLLDDLESITEDELSPLVRL